MSDHKSKIAVVPRGPSARLDHEWMDNRSHQYQNKWVALKAGQLLAYADTLIDLGKLVPDRDGVLFTFVWQWTQEEISEYMQRAAQAKLQAENDSVTRRYLQDTAIRDSSSYQDLEMSKPSCIDPRCLTCTNFLHDSEECIFEHPVREEEVAVRLRVRCSDFDAPRPKNAQEKLSQLIEDLQRLERTHTETMGHVVVWTDVEKLIKEVAGD